MLLSHKTSIKLNKDDCHESILKLLSDTNNENALEYRLCREKKKEKKTRSLSALPVGTVIKWKIGETERVAYKHEAAYQLKRPFWMAMDDSRYYKKTQISNNWEILETSYEKSTIN